MCKNDNVGASNYTCHQLLHHYYLLTKCILSFSAEDPRAPSLLQPDPTRQAWFPDCNTLTAACIGHTTILTDLLTY